MIDGRDLEPGDIVIWRRTRYEFVSNGCGGTRGLACFNHKPIAVYRINKRGERIHPGAGTQCLSADECILDPPRCITCGEPLTDDDPVVTTLGPRCAKHF